MYAGEVAPSGVVGLKVLRGGNGDGDWQVPWPARPLRLGEIAELGMAQRGLPDHVNDWRRSNRANLARGLRRVMAARALRLSHFYGALYLRVFRRDGTVDDLGLASLRVVTDAGVAYIVDAFQNTVELENLKFHGYGTGTTAESAAQTALVTELTTQYATDNTRPTGTTIEGATANIYRTVATLSPDSGGTIAVTEHGVFSANASGTLLDRSVFSAVNLVAGSDSLQTTYDLTLASGS